MCAYCSIGDWQFRRDPPFIPGHQYPQVPAPTYPLPPTWSPWPLADLKEFRELLERVKALEDALGCPCEPNKADYIGMLKERIDVLEKQMAAGPREGA